jgi:hypothetical protein
MSQAPVTHARLAGRGSGFQIQDPGSDAFFQAQKAGGGRSEIFNVESAK